MHTFIYYMWWLSFINLFTFLCNCSANYLFIYLQYYNPGGLYSNNKEPTKLGISVKCFQALTSATITLKGNREQWLTRRRKGPKQCMYFPAKSLKILRMWTTCSEKTNWVSCTGRSETNLLHIMFRRLFNKMNN